MRSNKFFSIIRIVLFVLVIAIGCTAGFIIPLRPEISESEGRVLTKFPEFSPNAFLSGDYTSGINLWYSDTFPERDRLMAGNALLKSFYGIKTEDFEGKGDKDDIDLEQTFVWIDDPVESGGEDFTAPPSEYESTFDSSNSEALETEPPESSETSGSDETEPPEKEVIDGYYVKGDSAYQLYYFDQALVDRYTKSIVNAALKLDGIANVYDIVVPTSTNLYLSEADISRLGCSDGNDAIEYIYKAIGAYSDQLVGAGRLSKPIVTLDVYPTLAAHKNEYIFFRTDHHWTGLGAYYTSRVFLDTVGRSYPSLDKYKEHRLDGFLGSLYKHTQNANLKNNPDTVYAYEPPNVKNLTVYDDNNNVYLEFPLIDPNVSSSNKYLCFSAGDRVYYEIHNEKIKDGSAILVVKESYGNAFLPMLAESYEYVYAVDYRFWNGDFVGLVKEKNIDTVLFLNVLTATVTNYNIWTMERCID